MSVVRVEKIGNIRRVFGWANVAADQRGRVIVDSHGDEIPVEELAEAAYDHVLNFRASGQTHQSQHARGRMVESVMFTPAKLRMLGLSESALPSGWWVGYEFSDPGDVASIDAGHYPAFSIMGIAEKVDD